MDALQAFVCAVQLDQHHVEAWKDLGVLYEVQGMSIFPNQSKNFKKFYWSSSFGDLQKIRKCIWSLKYRSQNDTPVLYSDYHFSSNQIDINEQLVIQLESTMANLDHQRKTYENKASFQKANFNTEKLYLWKTSIRIKF